MNCQEEYFKAYVDAVKRCRWFILTTVTLSALLLAQVALEEGAVSTLKANKDLIQALYHKKLAELSTSATPTTAPLIFTNQDVQAQLDFLRAAHTLEKTSLDVRKVPLLQLEIPSDEYETVLAVVLLIFAAGVWLTTRSIHAPLECMKDDLSDKNFRQLVLVYRIFSPTGAPSGRGAGWPGVIRFCALMLPTASVFAAFSYDLYEHTKGFTVVANFPFHMFVLFIAFGVALVFNIFTLLEIAQIDQLHYPLPAASGSNSLAEAPAAREHHEAQQIA